MILHENRLPADDSHEISCLICYLLKKRQIFNCRLLQIIGGALRVKLPKRCQFFLHFSLLQVKQGSTFQMNLLHMKYQHYLASKNLKMSSAAYFIRIS